MTKHITRQEWIDALRSGEYKQAFGSLYDPDTKGYCCLGVACSIAGISNKRLQENDHIYDSWNDGFAPRLYEETGISESQEGLLIYLNDEYDFTFAQIADVLASNFSEEVINYNKKKNNGDID